MIQRLNNFPMSWSWEPIANTATMTKVTKYTLSLIKSSASSSSKQVKKLLNVDLMTSYSTPAQ